MITIDYNAKTLLLSNTSYGDSNEAPVYHINTPGTNEFFDAHTHRNNIGCVFCSNPYISHNIHRCEFTPAARKYLKDEKTLPVSAYYFLCNQCGVVYIFHPFFGAIATDSEACKKLTNYINAITKATSVQQ